MVININDYSKQIDELHFSMPENLKFYGRALIVGGTPQGFNKLINAFNLVGRLGAGKSVLCLPKNLFKFIPKPYPSDINFLPAVKNGGFSKESALDLLNLSLASDCILLPGQLGRSSETAHVILNLIKNLKIPIVMGGDSILFLQNEPEILNINNIYLFLNLSLVQRLMGKIEIIKFSDSPHVIEKKLVIIASKVPINLCFILDAWLYAVIRNKVYRIKLDLRKNFNPQDSARPVKQSFSSINEATAPPPSDKTTFSYAQSKPEESQFLHKSNKFEICDNEEETIIKLAAKFTAIKTWSKKTDDLINLLLALKN